MLTLYYIKSIRAVDDLIIRLKTDIFIVRIRVISSGFTSEFYERGLSVISR